LKKVKKIYIIIIKMTNIVKELTANLIAEELEEIAPNYKRGVISNEEINKIMEKVATDIGVEKKDAIIGTMLLFLKGAASSGTPQTLAVDLRNGKTIAKKNVTGAYISVTGNNFVRRLAESMAVEIGEFAEKCNLTGELAQRINTILKAETGEILSTKESAWCSSFSQNIPDLATRSSDRVVRLLANDYKKRFENKKKTTTKETNTYNPKNKGKK
jgi:hypothetical protein